MMKPSAAARFAGSGAVHVSFAFLGMGAWAAFANRGHELERVLLAALVQGLISGAITFVLKRALEKMAARLNGPAVFIIPPAITCLIVLAVLVGVHRAAGTPQLWATIAVPYAVSSLYAWIYTAGLALSARRRTAGAAP